MTQNFENVGFYVIDDRGADGILPDVMRLLA